MKIYQVVYEVLELVETYSEITDEDYEAFGPAVERAIERSKDRRHKLAQYGEALKIEDFRKESL
jgi:hypothetical protein